MPENAFLDFKEKYISDNEELGDMEILEKHGLVGQTLYKIIRSRDG